MTASDAESWARLRLVQGESSAQKWELVSSFGHTTLTVGSGPDCAWVVQEEDVRPIHFSLHWDGNTLRVADVYNAGDVRVDGTLLTSHWRPLLGRVRIDFGKAAIVVETSANAQARVEPVSEQTPPFELRRGSQSPPRTTGKETLIGVAPFMPAIAPQHAPAALHGYVPEHGARPSSGKASETNRPRANELSMKATLVGGIAVTSEGSLDPNALPGAGPVQVVSPPAPKPNATLMGFNIVSAVRGAMGGQLAGASLNEADQRTAQGFPASAKASSNAPSSGSSIPAGRRMTQQGMVSQAPGVMPDAVAQVPARPISASADGEGGGRIGSAWEELAEADSFRSHTLRGIQEPEDDGGEPRGRGLGSTHWGSGDRLSDMPTQMRDPTTFELRRSNRGFPWRYLGVLVLTTVAYFAWLYLLDHM